MKNKSDTTPSTVNIPNGPSTPIALLIILAVVGIAWYAVKRATQQPSLDFTPPVTSPSPSSAMTTPLINADEDIHTLHATVTYREDTALTVLARKDENPALTQDRMLVIATHEPTIIESAAGKSLSLDAITINDRVTIATADPLSDEPVVFAKKIVVE